MAETAYSIHHDLVRTPYHSAILANSQQRSQGRVKDVPCAINDQSWFQVCAHDHLVSDQSSRLLGRGSVERPVLGLFTHVMSRKRVSSGYPSGFRMISLCSSPCRWAEALSTRMSKQRRARIPVDAQLIQYPISIQVTNYCPLCPSCHRVSVPPCIHPILVILVTSHAYSILVDWPVVSVSLSGPACAIAAAIGNHTSAYRGVTRPSSWPLLLPRVRQGSICDS